MTCPDAVCFKTVCTGNVALLQLTFKDQGAVYEGHAHTYHHLMLLASGRLRLMCNDKVDEYSEGAIIWIPKGMLHELTALEPFTVAYCIHALHKREDPGDVLDDAEVPGGTPPWLAYVPLLQKDARKEIADFDKLVNK